MKMCIVLYKENSKNKVSDASEQMRTMQCMRYLESEIPTHEFQLELN